MALKSVVLTHANCCTSADLSEIYMSFQCCYLHVAYDFCNLYLMYINSYYLISCISGCSYGFFCFVFICLPFINNGDSEL